MVRVDVGNFGDQNDPGGESHENAVNGGFHLSLSDLQFVFLVSCVGDSVLHLRGTRYGVVSTVTVSGRGSSARRQHKKIISD